MRLRARERLRAAFRRDLWITVGPAVALVAVAFAFTYHFIKPAPPHRLVVAAPRDEGGARYFARRYKDILARDGIALEVRETDGSAVSLRMLADESSGVDVAFVQGGVDGGVPHADIVSLGSLAYMPLWVVYRDDGEHELHDPIDLRGKRVAVGGPGGGIRALAMALLEANKAHEAPTELLPLEPAAAADQLAAGALDAFFAVAPAESPLIRKLTVTPGFRLMDFTRAEAYVRKFPYLKSLVLPRGVFDLARDVPAAEVHLIATTSNLVAREELHPALAYLLMRAATELHGSAGLLDRSREFPAPVEGVFPQSEVARRYYASGVPLLQRYLPFWAANLVERLWVMLLPVIAVVLPLARMVPPIYHWRVRRRIYRWYALLKKTELDLERDEQRDREALDAMLARLDNLDAAMRTIPTPLAYSENLYGFREHIDFVRRRIEMRLAALPRDRADAV